MPRRRPSNLAKTVLGDSKTNQPAAQNRQQHQSAPASQRGAQLVQDVLRAAHLPSQPAQQYQYHQPQPENDDPFFISKKKLTKHNNNVKKNDDGDDKEDAAADSSSDSSFDTATNAADTNAPAKPCREIPIPAPDQAGSSSPAKLLEFLGKERVSRISKRRDRRIMKQFGEFPALLLHQRQERSTMMAAMQNREDNECQKNLPPPNSSQQQQQQQRHQHRDLGEAVRNAVRANFFSSVTHDDGKKTDATAHSAIKLLNEVAPGV